jgi:hypothetical protein
MEAAPAGVVQNALFGYAFESPVGGFDARFAILAIVFATERRFVHRIACTQRGIVDLQRKTRVDHGVVVVFEKLRHRVVEFVTIVVVLVVKCGAKPARSEHWKDEVLDTGTGGDDRVFCAFDFVADGFTRGHLNRADDRVVHVGQPIGASTR